MSDLENSIKALEIRGARVATQAANDGIGTDLVRVLDAARKWATLTSPETIEKAARVYELASEDGRRFPYIVDDELWADWWANGDGADDLRKGITAALRAVEEDE